MNDLLRTMLFGLIPPELPMTTNGPPTAEETMTYRKSKRRWYRAVAAALWSLIISVGLFMAWAVGMIPRTTGLAYADDLKNAANEVTQKVAAVEQKMGGVEKALSDIALTQLENSLMNNRRLQCEAIKTNDSQRKATYAQIMQDLRTRYYRTEGVGWDQPGCEAL